MVQTLAQETSALSGHGVFVFNTVEAHTNCGEQGPEGYTNSGCLSSPSLSRPSLVDTSWFWLPVACCFPEPPLYTPVTSKFLAKAWVSPQRLQSSFSQVGFLPSTLPHPAGAPRILEPALLYLFLTPPTPSLLVPLLNPQGLHMLVLSSPLGPYLTSLPSSSAAHSGYITFV